jgi:hypothetical protein
MTTLCLSLICLLLAGYIVYEVQLSSRQSWRYEQIARADLLAQDAVELAKQQLFRHSNWLGTSNWIVRQAGSCQYKIQKNAELPISPTVQTMYPNGVFIQATGKTPDGANRVIVIWYIPSTKMTKAFEYV